MPEECRYSHTKFTPNLHQGLLKLTPSVWSEIIDLCELPDTWVTLLSDGECQDSCRLIQAAACKDARGGLRATRPIGVQLRVARLQRSGFEARAR
jgi:hypothetical protein